ncbi:MAG TPA: class I SAM-dependent methyltransferase [Solirubrobacteraceae bacterium]|nr:class I SAM-dependent methyltransferase [Solirubrobacteraceae bacterium]
MTSDIAVLERLTPVAGVRAVDVGCGNGWLARALAGAGARVTALEISGDLLAAARAAGEDERGVEYAVGRAEALPLPDATQDLVVFMRSLHHVPIEEMATALAEARRVLALGGAVYVSEPLPEGDWFELQAVIEVETETRAAALAAIEGCGAQGLRRVHSERYLTETLLESAAAFRARMLAVDASREALLESHRDELERAFSALGSPAPDGRGRIFAHAHRVDLLRAG